MQSSISVRNFCRSAVSVYIDDEPFFRSVLPCAKTRFRRINAGSAAVRVLSNREKLLFDLWLPVAPESRHILKIYDGLCIFISAPRS